MSNGPKVIRQQFCSNHPERVAIGVCVITAAPICGECSTRYEGVNYSKEGLRILRERRAAGTVETKSFRGLILRVLAWVSIPVQLYLVYLSLVASARLLIDLLHWSR